MPIIENVRRLLNLSNVWNNTNDFQGLTKIESKDFVKEDIDDIYISFDGSTSPRTVFLEKGILSTTVMGTGITKLTFIDSYSSKDKFIAKGMCERYIGVANAGFLNSYTAQTANTFTCASVYGSSGTTFPSKQNWVSISGDLL